MPDKPVVTFAKGADRIVSERSVEELVLIFGATGVFVDGISVADGGGQYPAEQGPSGEMKPVEREMLKDFERMDAADEAVVKQDRPKPKKGK